MSVSSRQISSTSTSQVVQQPRPSRGPPPITTVVTSPPWARDEPPSPTEHSPVNDTYLATEARPFDTASYNTSASQINSRWWSFTLPRPSRPGHWSEASPNPRSGKPKSSMSWLPSSASMREGASFLRKDKEKERLARRSASGTSQEWPLPLPSAPAAPFTLPHATTPGWDTPWTPRIPGPSESQDRLQNDHNILEHNDSGPDSTEDPKDSSPWPRRRKKLRRFVLTNTYVPLLFRFINITFTTAALGIAIKVRNIELKHNVMGAVGSSPTVVIIFTPLTLIHVMVAIYLEYFGRPLGLWKTSGKLAHTLLEVLFICAWSAALSLCFDNFFTSLIPCASPSSISWYNKLSRPPSGIPNLEGDIGDRICDDQLALICLVGIGLLAYCANLVISLFRIFEKVKYHPGAILRTS